MPGILSRFTIHTFWLVLIFSAQAAKATELHFVEAEKKMLSENLVLRQQKEAVQVQRQTLRLGYSAFLPKASASWTNQNKTNWDQTYSIDLTMNLFVGGTEYSTVGALRARLAAQEQLLKDQEDSLRLQLARAMLAGALANGKLEVLRRTKKTIDDRVTEQRRRLKLGQAREPDMLQSQIESLRLDRSISDLEQMSLQAKGELRSLLAVAESDALTLAPIEQLVSEIMAAIKPREQYSLAALHKEREALDFDARGQRRSHLPTLAAFASYGDASASTTSGGGADWRVGLKANWLFFDGLSLPIELRRAKAQSQIVTEKLRQAELDREISLGVRRSELATYQKNLASVKTAKEIAKKAVSVQQVDYRRGIVTELEVLSSIQKYLELQTEEIDLINSIALTRLSGLELGTSI